jgi:hypothetical protein
MSNDRSLNRNAPSGVAQIFNLLYRRIEFCKAFERSSVFGHSDACRLQIGDTAECNSALRLRTGPTTGSFASSN